MSNHSRQPHVRDRPMVECMRCHKQRRTLLLRQMICDGCYNNEPKTKCGVCGKEKRFVAEGAGVCPECVVRATKGDEIECARCGKSKPASKPFGVYCSLCQWKINCGKGRCSCCNKEKPYVHQEFKLCRRCNLNRVAPRRLQRYLGTVSISNEDNLTLFHDLIALIKRERINDETLLRVREFGTFLQTHQFPNPLTGESILELRTTMPGKKYARLRLCLTQLGELLLARANDRGLLEYKGRIKLPALVSSFDADIIVVFKKYDLWLRTERRNVSTARACDLRILGRFWRWCSERGLTSLAKVEAAHIDEYLHTIGLKWKCGQCSFTKNLTARGEAPPIAYERLECRALSSYVMVGLAVASTEKERATFRIFFGWLKDVQAAIEINPAPAAQRRRKNTRRTRQKRRSTNRRTIQYYDWEIIAALLNGIEDPNMPAAQAIALYFILHHAFYLGELRTVQIPLRCRPIALGAEPLESLENVLSVEFPRRELSRSKQFLGRSGTSLQMEPADEPWLRDLVSRLMRERNQKLRNPNNPYLFVAIGSSPRTGPVSISHLSRLVERATARITGRICTLNILGKCSRLLYSEFGGYEGYRHLRELGLGEGQARRYPWLSRVRVVPKQLSQYKSLKAQPPSYILTVPPMDVFGIPTDPVPELRKD
jgi:hypothetical protein